MANNRKYLGIRFPFTAKDSEGFFVDLDYNPYAEIKSDLIHLLFTQKGTRLRNPSFGTNLPRYIFEPNDQKTMTDIKIEIQESIKKYFPGINIEQFEITKEESGSHGLNIKLKYSIDEGTLMTTDEISINL